MKDLADALAPQLTHYRFPGALVNHTKIQWLSGCRRVKAGDRNVKWCRVEHAPTCALCKVVWSQPKHQKHLKSLMALVLKRDDALKSVYGPSDQLKPGDKS